jgi:hypothetical protein
MYYSQRMPALLNWQVQLLTLQLADQPEIKQIQSDTERLTRSAGLETMFRRQSEGAGAARGRRGRTDSLNSVPG